MYALAPFLPAVHCGKCNCMLGFHRVVAFYINPPKKDYHSGLFPQCTAVCALNENICLKKLNGHTTCKSIKVIHAKLYSTSSSIISQ